MFQAPGHEATGSDGTRHDADRGTMGGSSRGWQDFLMD